MVDKLEQILTKYGMSIQKLHSVLKKQGSPNELETLLQKHGLTEKELKTILSSSGLSLPKYAKLDLPDKHVRLGYFSDPHIGHEKFREDGFDLMIKTFKTEKPDFIVCPGDHLEGMSGRPGHIYELALVGFNAQIKHAVQLYDALGLPIFGIDGNHDGWFAKKNDAGVIVGEELEARLKNYTHLGQDEGDLEINPGFTIKLYHGADGTAYSDCFDDKTEILTENGWKLFKDLLPKEKVATMNLINEEFEWQLPEKYTDEDYDGEMLWFKSRTIDLVVTPNHRMLVRRYPTNILQGRKDVLTHPEKSHKRIDLSWIIKPASDLKDATRQEWQLLRTIKKWSGTLLSTIPIPARESKNNGVKVKHLGSLPIEDVAELIAWYVTEGHIRKSSLSIAQYRRINPENYYNIIELFKRIGLTPGLEKREQHITVGSRELCDWLVAECSSGSKNKHLPKWLKEQPDDILRIVFDTMVAGDGHLYPTGIGYCSISKQLLHDFQEIAIKLGYAVTEYGESVSVSNVQTTPTINSQPEIIHYKGRIYCVSVPNTIILVRRNGRAIWSGNSYKIQKLIESFTGGEKPNVVFSGHYHKSLFLARRNVFGFESGTLCGQSRFMRGKKIQAHEGFGIVDLYLPDKGTDELPRIRHEWVQLVEKNYAPKKKVVIPIRK